MTKLCEKYKWVPIAHKDRLVEDMTPDFLRMMDGMNKALDDYYARKRQVVATSQDKPAS